MKFFWGVVATLVVLIAAGLIVIWTGAFNVAATDPHWGPVRAALGAAMENSVRARASEEEAGSFDMAKAAEGFEEFDETCVHCHGAPGVEPARWTKGLRPNPPDLSEEAGEWNRAEVFWIVKHGIKMSGMPGLAPTHEDAEIRNIVAFVAQLPQMSPEDYAARRREAGEGGEEHAEE